MIPGAWRLLTSKPRLEPICSALFWDLSHSTLLLRMDWIISFQKWWVPLEFNVLLKICSGLYFLVDCNIQANNINLDQTGGLWLPRGRRWRCEWNTVYKGSGERHSHATWQLRKFVLRTGIGYLNQTIQNLNPSRVFSYVCDLEQITQLHILSLYM